MLASKREISAAATEKLAQGSYQRVQSDQETNQNSAEIVADLLR